MSAAGSNPAPTSIWTRPGTVSLSFPCASERAAPRVHHASVVLPMRDLLTSYFFTNRKAPRKDGAAGRPDSAANAKAMCGAWLGAMPCPDGSIRLTSLKILCFDTPERRGRGGRNPATRGWPNPRRGTKRGNLRSVLGGGYVCRLAQKGKVYVST